MTDMKRILATIAIILLAAALSWAQEGLQISHLFNGSFRPDSTVSTTTAVGGSLKSYKLETFQSIKFIASDDDIEKVSSWIMADSRNSSDIDITRDKGRMTYALICLDTDRAKHKYIGYQLKETNGSKSVTVVYMVGKASKDQLLRFFGKRMTL